MKTEAQVRKAIAEAKKDERYKSYVKSGAALVQINAPLALIQVGLKTQIATLEWVLENKESL